MKAYSTNIHDEAKMNDAFRRVVFTGAKMQLVVMSLKPHEEIGVEAHPDTDQFFHIEKGTAKFEFDDSIITIDDGSVVVVPAGTRHNVINPSSYEDLKFYTIYAPPQHPGGTLQKSKAEAEVLHPVTV